MSAEFRNAISRSLARVSAAGALAATFGAWAQTAAVPAAVSTNDAARRTSLEAGYVRETLSTNPDAWHDAYTQLLHRYAPRTVAIGRFTESSRFGLDDTTLLGAGYLPLAGKTTLFVEAAVSPTHHVLPAHTTHVQVNQQLVHGWALQGGWKHMTYNTTSVELYDVTVERYFGAFRAALTLTPSRSATAGSAFSRRFQVGYYYGDANAVQISVASGSEVDLPSGVDSVVRMDVRNVSVYGQHALTPVWTVVYGVGRTEQGVTRRNAVNAGLRMDF